MSTMAEKALGACLVEDDASSCRYRPSARAVVDVSLDGARHSDLPRGRCVSNDEVDASSAPGLSNTHVKGLKHRAPATIIRSRARR